MLPEINYLAIIVAGLIPSIIGAVYYGTIFEKQWLSSLGKTKEEMVPDNMAVAYGLALLAAMVLSFSFKMIIEMMHKTVENGELVFGSHHTFGHGAMHGAFFCLVVICPVILSKGLFQKTSGKNILINSLFWIICAALMGGVLDSWN